MKDICLIAKHLTEQREFFINLIVSIFFTNEFFLRIYVTMV